MRLFIGIPANENLKKEVKDFYEKEKLPKASWVKVENLHITLKFLGEVMEKKAMGLIEKFEDLLPELNCKKYPYDGASAFPDEKRPRVLFLKFNADEEIFLYQKKLEEILMKEGFEREEREFKIHLTLARFKFPPEKEEFKNLILKLSNFNFSPFEVKEIVLFESKLKPEGAEYFPLKKIKCK